MSTSGGGQCYYCFLLYYPHVLTYICRGLPSLYGWVLGLGKEDVGTIVFGDGVDFVAIISYLHKNSHTPNGVFKRATTILCLLEAFLFMDGPIKKQGKDGDAFKRSRGNAL